MLQFLPFRSFWESIVNVIRTNNGLVSKAGAPDPVHMWSSLTWGRTVDTIRGYGTGSRAAQETLAKSRARIELAKKSDLYCGLASVAHFDGR